MSNSKPILRTEDRGPIGSDLTKIFVDELKDAFNNKSTLTFFTCANFTLIKNKRTMSNKATMKRLMLHMNTWK